MLSILANTFFVSPNTSGSSAVAFGSLKCLEIWQHLIMIWRGSALKLFNLDHIGCKTVSSGFCTFGDEHLQRPYLLGI